MKILKSDLRHGLIFLKIEREEDIWHLKNVLEMGDQIEARTLRSKFIDRDGQKIKTGKIPMKLKISLEKVEFNENSYKLRLMGKIIEGPEDVQLGSYHTIEIETGDSISITKKWKNYQLERIKKSQISVPKVLMVAVDNNEATFASLDGRGQRIISEIRNQHSLQYEEEKLKDFYTSVAKEISNLSQDSKKIVLAGPGFAKEHVKEILEKNDKEATNKLLIDSVSSATRSGINEILKRGNLEKIIEESEVLSETKLIEEFFTHLKKEDGLSAYGLEEIKEAENIGAIEILLVGEEKIKNEDIEKLADSVEEKGGKVEIISTTHPSGEQFDRMGGLGAILRFKFQKNN